MIIAGLFAASLAFAPGRVLVLGLDGCRPDAMLKADTPYIDSLIQDGAFAVGQANLITVSGPCWSSIMCGVWDTKHGVKDNGFGGANYSDYPDFLTLIEQVKPELRTVGITAWKPVKDQIIKTADYEGPVGDGDRATALEVAHELKENDPHAIMVHLDEPDHAGHTYTYSPEVPEYIKGIETTDDNIGIILEALRARPRYKEENWLVILTSDHGGTGYGHGLSIPEHIDIPFIVSGRAARSEFLIRPRQIDVAPTVFAHLGLEPPAKTDWDGVPVGLRAVDSKHESITAQSNKPRFTNTELFAVEELSVGISGPGEVRYTLDGTLPSSSSPLYDGDLKLFESTIIKARAFNGEKPIGPSTSAYFQVQPYALLGFKPAGVLRPGILFALFEKELKELPKARVAEVDSTGVSDRISLAISDKDENYGVFFDGLLKVEESGIFEFRLTSDDGSRLLLGDTVVINHDGLHGPSSKHGFVALTEGFHELFVAYFQAGGGAELKLEFRKSSETQFVELDTRHLFYEINR